jgi:hypothetical protein
VRCWSGWGWETQQSARWGGWGLQERVHEGLCHECALQNEALQISPANNSTSAGAKVAPGAVQLVRGCHRGRSESGHLQVTRGTCSTAVLVPSINAKNVVATASLSLRRACRSRTSLSPMMISMIDVKAGSGLSNLQVSAIANLQARGGRESAAEAHAHTVHCAASPLSVPAH